MAPAAAVAENTAMDAAMMVRRSEMVMRWLLNKNARASVPARFYFIAKQKTWK
jgi:hypothetical protein